MTNNSRKIQLTLTKSLLSLVVCKQKFTGLLLHLTRRDHQTKALLKRDGNYISSKKQQQQQNITNLAWLHEISFTLLHSLVNVLFDIYLICTHDPQTDNLPPWAFCVKQKINVAGFFSRCGALYLCKTAAYCCLNLWDPWKLYNAEIQRAFPAE